MYVCMHVFMVGKDLREPYDLLSTDPSFARQLSCGLRPDLHTYIHTYIYTYIQEERSVGLDGQTPTDLRTLPQITITSLTYLPTYLPV